MSYYKSIIILIIFLGILLITIEITRTSKKCPSEKIIYRYIPKTFEQEQKEPAYVSDIFKTLFNQPSPWIRSVDNMTIKKKENINKYFVSQS